MAYAVEVEVRDGEVLLVLVEALDEATGLDVKTAHHLTPAEARDLASMLTAAADDAQRGARP